LIEYSSHHSQDKKGKNQNPNNKNPNSTTVSMRQKQTQHLTLAASIPFSTGGSIPRIAAASTIMDSGTSWQVTAPPFAGLSTHYRSRYPQGSHGSLNKGHGFFNKGCGTS